MRTLSPFQLWYGRDEPPAEPRLLRAGPLTALLDGRDLRYLRLGDVELVRRLYVAVRDHNWDTIPGALANVQIDAAADHFQARFDVRHHQGPVNFSWRGEIAGSAEGTITYTMEGSAASDFRYNRIGCCVLHPPDECAGRPYRGQTPDGPIQGTLPLRIGPQRIVDGTILALFPAVESLAIDPEPGLTVRFDFEGDLFEMEDQRNWTDASFKTYCTPLALPWPKQARAGQTIRQRVTVSVAGAPGAAARAPEQTRCRSAPLQLTLGEPPGTGCPLGQVRRLPSIGLGMASHGQALSAREIEMLRVLRPDHLRVDLRLQDSGYSRDLERAMHAGESLGCALELALFMSDAWEDQLRALASLLAPPPPIARILVFHTGREPVDAPWIRAVRERLRELAPGTPVAGGTNVYFCELNRNPPSTEALDAVVYTINPQVHAFDELSMVESVAAQAETVTSARALCRDLPVIVSPVTLKPRFNPNATEPEKAPPPDQLPPAVDPRQMSLFAAAWTLGSIKHLAESGAASVTYYETTGWRGVIDSETGSRLPDRFPSEPGIVFPLYHILADLADCKPRQLLACQSSDPLAVLGMAAHNGTTLRVLLANMTPTPQQVVVESLDDEVVSLRRLNAESAPLAMSEPQRYRSAGETMAVAGRQLTVALSPYETVRIDAPLQS
jgi:hypothetical protein